MPHADADIEQLAINVVRGLAMDAPRQANSGHPGTAMALAPLATVLFTRVLRHDPAEPYWPDRDRFVLSAGHASILLYSMLYLSGYGLTLEDIRAFRQWGSHTPGHPEVHHTTGVEVTTGPLGQGFANAVGMAIAERRLRAQFGAELIDHRIYAIAGDGCLQEGISHEAASLAGHLGLGRLVVVYDDNHITIDGPTELSFTDDTAKRFESYGWRVERLGEIANDCDALEAALRSAAADDDRPSLLVSRSHIGYPSPKFTDHEKAHGDPFPPEEIAVTKTLLGLPPDQSFWVPDEVVDWFARAAHRHGDDRRAWEERLAGWTGDRAEWDACWAQRAINGWASKLPSFPLGEKMATRVAINTCINDTLDVVPGVMAGGADLTGNTGTKLAGQTMQSREHPGGRQIYFGVREHAMGAAMNGMALHGGVIPVGGTFLVFSDYMRGAVRLAAMSEAKAIFVWTHDSVGLGEDGPTHQPIEQLMSLRLIPRLRVIRPADANETAQAWRIAVEHDGATALILSRQPLPIVTEAPRVELGAYALVDVAEPELVLIGTGSEVSVCLDAAGTLAGEGVSTRVVSMPSWDLFALQPDAYRDELLPAGVARLSVEAGVTTGWERYADRSVGIDRFGGSAPGAVALRELGINAANVVDNARALLAGRSKW